MKKLLVLIVLVSALQFTVSAQIREIPAAATESFSAKYPTAKKVAWKDNLLSFEASFTMDKLSCVSKFNNKGEWLETDKKLSFANLNDAIKDGFRKSKYTSWEIRGAMEIQQNDKELEYRILIKKGPLQKMYLFYNIQGQLQREQATL